MIGPHVISFPSYSPLHRLNSPLELSRDPLSQGLVSALDEPAHDQTRQARPSRSLCLRHFPIARRRVPFSLPALASVSGSRASGYADPHPMDSNSMGTFYEESIGFGSARRTRPSKHLPPSEPHDWIIPMEAEYERMQRDTYLLGLSPLPTDPRLHRRGSRRDPVG